MFKCVGSWAATECKEKPCGRKNDREVKLHEMRCFPPLKGRANLRRTWEQVQLEPTHPHISTLISTIPFFSCCGDIFSPFCSACYHYELLACQQVLIKSSFLPCYLLKIKQSRDNLHFDVTDSPWRGFSCNYGNSSEIWKVAKVNLLSTITFALPLGVFVRGISDLSI